MKKANKMCGFYVNEWHLTMMVLPYIKDKIEKKENVIIISNEDLKNNIKTILDKLNLKDEIKQEAYKIGNNIIKAEELADDINKIDEIIIVGKENYINDVNKKIEKMRVKENLRILDCYEVMDFNKSIEKILLNHEKLVNTAGERSIEEVFEGFEKKEII